MDTKEKRREKPRQRDTEQKRRRSADDRESGKKKAAARQARKAAPKRPEGREEQQERRRPAQPEKRAVPEGQERRRSSRDAAGRQTGTSIPRPQRQEGEVRFSAPQGTGPRKSAPKLSEQEVAERRRQQKQQTVPQQENNKKNALQNFISGIRNEQTGDEDAASRAKQRREQRAASAEKKKKHAQRYDTPAVIYTQPMAFNRDRLLIQLLSITAMVAAFVLGMSVFFKVKHITVSGSDTYGPSIVVEASGISEGDNLLTFSKAKASAKIQAELGYVDEVRIGIKLPDTVIIYIEEAAVCYSMEADTGDWWLINSDGKVVEQINEKQSDSYTKVLGVQLDNPQVGSAAVGADGIPTETLESGEYVPLSVTGAQRMSSALQILKAMEANDIVGEAASLDVSDLSDITMMYGSQYEVLLGDTSRMEYKIACMNDAILELSEYQSGILDVSFRIWTDQIGYTPFG